MKTDLILAPTQIRELLEFADEIHNLDKIFEGYEPTGEDLISYLVDTSWMVTLISDKGRFHGFVLLEWTGKRVATIHLTLFNKCNFYRGFKSILELVSEYVDEINTYITLDREDVVKIGTALGFNFKIIKGIYHGQIRKSMEKGRDGCFNGWDHCCSKKSK